MQGKLDIFLKNAPRQLVTKPVVDFFRATFWPSDFVELLFSFTVSISANFASRSSTPSRVLFRVFAVRAVKIALQLFVEVGREIVEALYSSSSTSRARRTFADELFRTTLVAGRRDPP